MEIKEQKVQYPIYRKYPHNRTFFKVISDEEFEELNIMKDRFSLRQFKVELFPDRVFVHDLTHNFQAHWEPIEPSEYEDMKTFCREYLEKAQF